jgi:cell wall-associated NlpC family hydrolase
MAFDFPDLGIDWGKARQELHTDLGDVWGKVNSAATNSLGRIADAGQGAGSTLGRIAQAGASGGNQLARIAQAGGQGGGGLERIAGYGDYGGGNSLDFFSTLAPSDPFAKFREAQADSAAAEARKAAQSPVPTSGATGAMPGDASWGNPDTAAIERQLGARGARNAAISAESVQRLAHQYGVPVAVVLAVLNQESGYGTDQNDLTANNNFMGLTGTGTRGSVSHAQPDGSTLTFATFNTPEEGLEAAIRNMAGSQYHNLGLGQYLALYLTGNVNGGTDSAGNHTADYVNNAIAIAQGLGLNVNANTVVVRPGGVGGAGGSVEQVAASLLGTPYELGGRRAHANQPQLGIDCSEYTAWVYEHFGVQLPWNAQQQYDATRRIGAGDLQPGDLVFFAGTDPNNNQPVTHVGIYVGNGKMINAQDNGVSYADLNSDYWRSHTFGYGRVVR